MGYDDDEIGTASLESLTFNLDTLVKDYTLAENWITEVIEVSKTPPYYDHKYTFEINDDDF